MLHANKRTFKVLSFNTWLLKTPFGFSIAEHVDARAQLIPSAIATLNPDIISLQEVWSTEHRDQLIRDFQKLGYPYAAFRADTNTLLNPLEIVRAKFGNGLLIISKYEIHSEVLQLRFQTHTRADERAVIKGAILARILVPGLGWMDFFNSHLGAVTFDKHSHEYYPKHIRNRFAQAQELSHFLLTHKKNDFCIGALDLDGHYHVYEKGNYTGKLSDDYHLFTSQEKGMDFIDVHRHVHGIDNTPHWTFDKKNPYVSGGYFSHAPNEVIDYIFVNRNQKIIPVHSEIVFQEPQGREKPHMLSDHYGVLATFEIRS